MSVQAKEEVGGVYRKKKKNAGYGVVAFNRDFAEKLWRRKRGN